MSWPLVKLGKVCKLVNGDRGTNYPSKDSILSNGIPFINAGNLTEDHSIACSGANYISEERYDLLSNGKIQHGDILFCLRGSLGKFAVVDLSIPKGAIASSLVIIRPDKSIYENYLKNYLRSTLCIREISRFENGAAQPNLSAKDLREFEIPLPPLPEQKRIAAILDKADAIRRKRQQAIQLADDFLRAVFLDMFGDPVTNPKGWEVKAIKEMAVVTTGNTPPRDNVEYYGDFIEWIKSDNINTPSDYLTEAAEYLSEAGYTAGRHVASGSTLLTCIAGSFDCIGNAAYTDREVAFNQQINALTPKVGVNALFLYALAKYCKKTIQAASTGGMKGMVSKGKLEEVRFICPPESLQQNFAEAFYRYQDVRKGMDHSLSELNDGFSSISQKAFSGQL